MQPFVTRTTGDVVSELIMSRTAFSGSFFVVEGDTDSRFFSRRLAKTHCQTVIAGAKQTVCGAVLGAYQSRLDGILGVVDDDYDSLCGVANPSNHIVRTDARDLECPLLRSEALESVLHEAADLDKLTAFERAEGCSAREALVKRGLIFGKLRLLNRQHQWNISFDEFSPWRFADLNSWTIDESAIVALAANRLQTAADDIAALLANIALADPYRILHGRDTVNLLAIGLRRRIGNAQYSADLLVQMLRLAFDDALAAGCALFQAIRQWEAANAPYRILA
jgi:hypothetical protein